MVFIVWGRVDFYQEVMGKDEKIRRICMQLVEMMVVMGKDRMIQLPEIEEITFWRECMFLV